MQNTFSDKPVVAADKLIFGPQEAGHFLHADWPYGKNTDYVAAIACVLKTLNGQATPDEARELFEIAI